MNNTGKKTTTLCIYALFMALICIVTMFTKIPIPLGYAHLGDCLILSFAIFYGKKAGFIVGGIGSAMSDLLSGYVEWIIPTLLIKGIMAILVALIARSKEGNYKIYSIRTALAAIAGMLFMVVGYVVSGIAMEGFAAGISSAPGLLMKSIVNIIAFYFISTILEKVLKNAKKQN